LHENNVACVAELQFGPVFTADYTNIPTLAQAKRMAHFKAVCKAKVAGGILPFYLYRSLTGISSAQ
jgi:hypothetical protein